MNRKLLLFLCGLLTAASPLWAGFYDQIRNLPEDVLKSQFPVVAALDKDTEIEWFHVIGVAPDASDNEINKRAKTLRVAFHETKELGKNYPAVAGIIGQAAAKQKELKPGEQDPDQKLDSKLSARDIVMSLLPKKFIGTTAGIAALSYALYRVTKTTRFRNAMHRLDARLQRKSKLLHTSLHLGTIATSKTVQLVWNIAKIPTGIALCITALPLGLIGAVSYGIQSHSGQIGDTEIKIGNAIFTKNADGTYHQSNDPKAEAALEELEKLGIPKMPERDISEDQLRQMLNGEDLTLLIVKLQLPLGAALFISGCHTVASGFRGIKNVATTQKNDDESLVLT